jgi:hypothetical protein
VLLRARGQLDPLALDFIATCTRSALPSCIVPVIVTSVTVTTISGFVCTRRSAACEDSLRDQGERLGRQQRAVCVRLRRGRGGSHRGGSGNGRTGHCRGQRKS